MKNVLLTLVFLSLATEMLAQDRVQPFSQWIAVTYQPSFVAWDNAASVSFANSRTHLGSGISYQSNAFVGEYPFIKTNSGRRLGGIGVHVEKKDAGNADMLNAAHLGLTLAYNLPVAKNHFVTFGLQGTFNQTKTSLDRLTTGNQWLAEQFRFDPTADLGETISKNQVQYGSVHTGISWLWHEDPMEDAKAIVGVSVFDLNSPNVSFFPQENQLGRAMLIHGGAQLLHKKRWSLWSQVFYKNDIAGSIFYFQTKADVHFVNDNPYDIVQSGKLELVAQYDMENSVMTGIALHQPHLSIAFSYNIALSVTSDQMPFRNGTDFAIRVSKIIWRRKPSVIIVQSTPIGNKRKMNFEQSKNATAPVTQQPSDVEVIQENIHDVSKINSVRFELDKDFKYGFGKSDLSDDAKSYLNELGALLAQNPEYQLEVIGHTDNVGKPLVNYRLSVARAKIVANYLIANGIAPERIKSAGRGDTEPLASNDSEEQRAKNRRVHFIIYVNR